MIWKIIIGLISLFFFCLGLLVGILEIIALINPVGTKMSDDADPFGDPHRPWYVHACYFLFVFICFGISYLIYRIPLKTNTNLKLQ